MSATKQPRIIRYNEKGGLYAAGVAFTEEKWVEIQSVYQEIVDKEGSCSERRLAAECKISVNSATKAIISYNTGLAPVEIKRGHGRCGMSATNLQTSLTNDDMRNIVMKISKNPAYHKEWIPDYLLLQLINHSNPDVDGHPNLNVAKLNSAMGRGEFKDRLLEFSSYHTQPNQYGIYKFHYTPDTPEKKRITAYMFLPTDQTPPIPEDSVVWSNIMHNLPPSWLTVETESQSLETQALTFPSSDSTNNHKTTTTTTTTASPRVLSPRAAAARAAVLAETAAVATTSSSTTTSGKRKRNKSTNNTNVSSAILKAIPRIESPEARDLFNVPDDVPVEVELKKRIKLLKDAWLGHDMWRQVVLDQDIKNKMTENNIQSIRRKSKYLCLAYSSVYKHKFMKKWQESCEEAAKIGAGPEEFITNSIEDEPKHRLSSGTIMRYNLEFKVKKAFENPAYIRNPEGKLPKKEWNMVGL